MKSAETPGERMAAMRKLRGWSQSRLAKEAGLSKATVSRLEGNLLSPELPSMRRCMKAMKLRPEEVEFIMHAQAPETASAQGAPTDMQQVQRELDMLTRNFPMLDQVSRSIIMSVLWLEMNRLKSVQHDMTALVAPLVQEWSNRILDQVEAGDADWKITLELARQTAAEAAAKRSEAPATQADAAPERSTDKGDVAPLIPIPSGSAGGSNIVEMMPDDEEDEEEEDDKNVRIEGFSEQICAGDGIGRWEEPDCEFYVSRRLSRRHVPPPYATFAARLSGKSSGKSMEPEFPDGCLLYIRQMRLVGTGDIGVFYVDGYGHVCRRLMMDRLESLNPEFDDIMFDAEVCEHMVCTGKVEGYCPPGEYSMSGEF